MADENLTPREGGPFRTDRYFHIMTGGPDAVGWYFRTREGTNYGPYVSRDEAERRCTIYIKSCVQNNITGGRGGTAGNA